jgi:PP-loop superfamily ATP-utilizing enzyme
VKRSLLRQPFTPVASKRGRCVGWSGALLGSRSVDSTSVVAAAEQASGPNHAACHLSRTVQPERAVSVTAIVAKKTGLHRVETLGLA